MAYADHAFSISDEDIMMDSDSYTVHNRPPIKEIALAVAFLVFGVLGIVFGIIMSINKVGGDRAHGLFFAILVAEMSQDWGSENLFVESGDYRGYGLILDELLENDSHER